MSSHRLLSHRQSAYCPTCKSFTSQSRGYKYGTRYCGICGDEFSLQQSREAFTRDHVLTAEESALVIGAIPLQVLPSKD